MSNVQTVTLDGKRFVILPEAEYLRLSGEPPEPELPPPDANGNYPARETLQVVRARRLIRARGTLGWTQAELARRAGVPVETVSELELGTHAGSKSVFQKLQRVLDTGEAKAARARRAPAVNRRRKV